MDCSAVVIFDPGEEGNRAITELGSGRKVASYFILQVETFMPL